MPLGSCSNGTILRTIWPECVLRNYRSSIAWILSVDGRYETEREINYDFVEQRFEEIDEAELIENTWRYLADRKVTLPSEANFSARYFEAENN